MPQKVALNLVHFFLAKWKLIFLIAKVYYFTVFVCRYLAFVL
jgi:hypothetical protein